MVAMKLALCDLIKTLKNPKLLVILLLSIFFFFDEVLDMRSMAEMLQIGITSYVYPIFLTSWHGRMYALVLVVMVMGEAPYYNGAEVFMRMRVSRYQWLAGKLIYIFVLSAIFQVVMIVISILVCFPYMALSDGWGDIINTYMRSIQGGVSASGTIDNISLLNLKPMVCMVYEFVLMVLVGIIIALAMFVLNGAFKNIMGTVIVGAMVVFDIYLDDLTELTMRAFKDIPYIEYMLPTAWVDLNCFFTGVGLTFEKCVIYMLIIIAVLVAISYILVGKRIIQPVKNV